MSLLLEMAQNGNCGEQRSTSEALQSLYFEERSQNLPCMAAEHSAD